MDDRNGAASIPAHGDPRTTARTRATQGGIVVLAWASLTGLLVACGEGVDHSSVLASLDKHVTASVASHRTSLLNGAMKAVTWLGSWIALVATGVMIIVLALRRRLSWGFVGVAVVAWAGEAGAVATAKRVVERPRPPQSLWLVVAHGWSWPSGHAAVAVVIFATLAVIASILVRPGVPRVSVWIACSLAVAAVGFSRIELGVHWTTDVVGSVVFVSAWVVGIAALATRGCGSRVPPFTSIAKQEQRLPTGRELSS